MANVKNGSGEMKPPKLFYFPFMRGFFASPNIRRLEKKFGSDGVMIYLKLADFSLDSCGCIERVNEDMGESFAEEIAFNIDMGPDTVSDTIKYCIRLGLIVPDVEDKLFHIPYVTDNIKSLTDSAIRMRKKRARDRQKQSEGDDSSQSDGERHKVTESKSNKSKQNTELENSNNYSYSLNSDILFDETDVSLYGEGEAVLSGAAEAAADPAASPLSEAELMELSNKHKVFLSDKGISAFSEATHGGTTTYWNDEPSESPLKIMRAWKKKNKEKHPEYFMDQEEEKASAADPEDKPLPVWDSESPDYCGNTNGDYEAIKNIIKEYPESKYDELYEIGIELARNKDCNSRHWPAYAEAYAALHILLEHEKKHPGILSNREIAAAFKNYDGYEDDEFYEYFLTHRA